ncbi:AlpA family phage regulatory protein [Sphingopyxis witflariensis]
MGAGQTRHRPPHQGQSLLAIIANKQVERQKNRVVRTPDPTTIEFQTTFREMIVAAARDGHRLLIVVDNLDRLPGAEAIDMWTTIRSFFLGAIPAANPTDGGPPSLVALPTIILPIDTHALERVFDGGELGGSKTVAESFMDKTFDVTFHVSPPVLSEWHAYLAKLMREALGDKLTDQWSADVGRIFEKRNIARVTPRDLNRMVNAIAALWLQWEPVGIPFLTVAYYAMMRQGFDPNYMQAINSPAFDLSEHDPDWQRSLAALHFGVEPKASLQILLEPELRAAILDCNHQVFESQVQTKGFEQVLYGQIDTPDTMERGLANLCELLDQAAVDEKPWADFTWRKIRHVFLRSDLADQVGEKASTALKILVARLPVQELGNFLREAGQRMTVPAPGVATQRTSLAPYLYARTFDEGAIVILRMLIGADHQHAEARKHARHTLRAWLNAEVGAARWEDEVRNGEALLDLADELQNLEKRPLALQDDGVVALKALFGELTGNPSHALRKRWFRLAHMLAAKARKSVLPDLRDHILASGQITDPLAFFDMAGAFLLTGGEFAARADESLRLLIMPQLQSIEGLGWLQRDADSITHWIAKATAMTSQPPDRFLRINAVLDRTGLSRATLYRKVHAGTFPPQYKLAQRCCGWRESHVSVWQRNPITFTVDDLPPFED